jgi:hypothetical protein
MQRIIVTADDCGMCDAVDREIDAGIEIRKEYKLNGFVFAGFHEIP